MRNACSCTAAILLCAGIANAQGPQPLSPAKAKELIQTLTRIGMCNDDQQYSFTSVEVAPPVSRPPEYDAPPTLVYPVRVRYTVDCTQGNHNMRYGAVEEHHTEVAGTFGFYLDSFKAWKMRASSDLDEDQHWDDADVEIRCRSQRLAYLTYDSSGKLIKRRPDTHPEVWGDCGVRAARPR